MDATNAPATPETPRQAIAMAAQAPHQGTTASRQARHQTPSRAAAMNAPHQAPRQTATASRQPPHQAVAENAPRHTAAAHAPRQAAATAASAHSPLSRRPHRLLVCPECGGRLHKDKHPVMAETGTALRKRLCSRCGCAVYSRQLAEEITMVEYPE